MNSDEHWRLSEAAGSELAAIDAALQGEPVTAEHGELSDLAVQLRDDRPRPEDQFTARLDGLAARGFRAARGEAARPAPASHAPTAGARSRRPMRGLRPAIGATVGAIAAIAAVITFAVHFGGSGARVTPDAAIPASGSAAHGVLRAGPERSARPGPGASKAAESASAPSYARQVESSAALNVGVAHARFASADQQVFSIVNSFHGYVQQSSSTSGGEQQGSASFQLRVPSANSAGAIAAISQLGRVLSETNTTNDVTDRVGSLQRSLGDARSQRAGLLRQLATTSSPPRSEALRARLSEVEAQISEDQASLRSLDNNVAFSTIAVTLTGERPAGAGSSQGDLTPGGALRDSAQILSAALAVFLLAAAATLPVAIALLLAWAAVVSLRRRQREQTLDAG